MTKKVNVKSEFIFRKDQNGKLHFVGDFDGLYKNNIDPWAQSAKSDVNYKRYYNFSRRKIVSAIKRIENRKTVLEIGCGTGFCLDFLAYNLTNTSFSGVDISTLAIERARDNFPEHKFTVGDIQSSKFSAYQEYDIVIFNQILWYILENLNTAFRNAHGLLRTGGHFLISTGFLKEEQRYGAEIINGFDGCKEFIRTHHKNLFLLTDSQFDQSDDLPLNDGILVYQKLPPRITL